MKTFLVRDTEILEVKNIANEIKGLNINPDDLHWAELEIRLLDGTLIEAKDINEAEEIANKKGLIDYNHKISDEDFKELQKITIKSNSLKDLLQKTKDYWYHKGYGAQYLFGHIVLKDGSWHQRKEYDGYEWWEYCQAPKTPSWVKDVK